MPSIVQNVFSLCKVLLERLSLAYQCSCVKTTLRTLAKELTALRVLPIALWNGNAQHGYAILNGFFQICDERGTQFQKTWTTPEDLFKASTYFASYLYRFEFLRDLKATGDISARRLARRLIEYFFHFRKEYLAYQHSVFVTAERLSNLILLYDFFGASSDSTFRKTFFKGLRQDYRMLRRHLLSTLQSETGESRFAVIKALMMYNAYVEEDAVFFKQLLYLLSDVVQTLEETAPCASASMLFRSFCGLMDLRNALLQYEKIFLSSYPYYQKTYQRTFQTLQVCLQRFTPFLRFHRHSNGRLCRFVQDRGSKDIFFEPIFASWIDTALSQVESNPDLPALERRDILRWAYKRSVLFLGLCKQEPNRNYRMNKYKTSPFPNVMNVEWSVQSLSVIQKSSVSFLIREECDSLPFTAKTNVRYRKTEDGFEGLYLMPGYAFKRAIRLASKEMQLNSEDELLVHEMDEALALESLTFGPEWILDRILHEPSATHGEILFYFKSSQGLSYRTKKNNPERTLCHLKIDTTAPFSIKKSTSNGATRLTSILLLEPGQLQKISWSIQISKE